MLHYQKDKKSVLSFNKFSLLQNENYKIQHCNKSMDTSVNEVNTSMIKLEDIQNSCYENEAKKKTEKNFNIGR